jgi:superfamily II DNA/RNA helicase
VEICLCVLGLILFLRDGLRELERSAIGIESEKQQILIKAFTIILKIIEDKYNICPHFQLSNPIKSLLSEKVSTLVELLSNENENFEELSAIIFVNERIIAHYLCLVLSKFENGLKFGLVMGHCDPYRVKQSIFENFV